MAHRHRDQQCYKCHQSLDSSDITSMDKYAHVFHRRCFSLYGKISQMECPICSNPNNREETDNHSTSSRTNSLTRSNSNDPTKQREEDSSQNNRSEQRPSLSSPSAADDGQEKMEVQYQYEILTSSARSRPSVGTDPKNDSTQFSSSILERTSGSDQEPAKPFLSRFNSRNEACGASNESTTSPEGQQSPSMPQAFSSAKSSRNDVLSHSQDSSPPGKENCYAQQSEHQQKKSSPEWKCSECEHGNDRNRSECTTCIDGQRSPTEAKKKSTESKREMNNEPLAQRVKSPKSSIVSEAPPRDHIVFIPELPYGISKPDLEEMIRLRLTKHHHVQITKVVCYPNLSVGIIFVQREEDVDNFVYELQLTVLNPQTSTNIGFVAKLELISYIVFDETIKTSLSTDEITRRWQEHSQTSETFECQRVALSFPNIFKLITRDREELDFLETTTDFEVRNQTAKLYFNADCCFFENLPTDLTTDQLLDAINTHIDEPCDQRSLYVQHNRRLAKAIVLSTGAARQWRNTNMIHLDNQKYTKKKKLTVDEPSDAVVVQDQQSEYLHSPGASASNQMAVKLKDRPVYDKYAEEDGDINERNWYGREMLSYEPKLETFLLNRHHPIFKWKWNSRFWLEQFRRYDGQHNREFDRERRLLRVTVMLNTIGVLRKSSYTADTSSGQTDIRLKPQRMKSIVYNHRSKLADQQEIDLRFTTRFASTIVKVTEEDCLVVHQKLLRENKNPVLLNMANDKTPGGGYRKGAGAQEENIFRRSNYYLSLDMELDEDNEADRFLRTDDCRDQSIGKHHPIYPIEQYGAIYTSGMTVFRDTELKGYALLEQPVYGVCAIASAAYVRPKLKSTDPTMLDEKYAVDTRKKIENFFAIAYHHGHDCLVLSAFGCGAFRNPPDHIAKIYKSVIEQYAGHFREIYFAIIDDHNTGGQHNPNGNFRPFQQILNDLEVSPPRRELDVNMISGPFRIVEKYARKLLADHIKIYDRPPCRYASSCRTLNDHQHRQSYSHPPFCSQYDSCDRSLEDEVHFNSFLHRPKSQPVARNKFDKKECSSGSYCPRFHDQEHLDTQRHPFPTPCPFTPFACTAHAEYLQKGAHSPSKIKPELVRHCEQFSHVCPYGRQCRDQKQEHLRTSIHVARHNCPYLPDCPKLSDEEHIHSFTHPNVNDIRYICYSSKAECRDTEKQEHIVRYRHRDNCDRLAVVPYFGLNRNLDFLQNQKRMKELIRQHADSCRWTLARDSLEEVTEWIRALQPVYRCNQYILQSMLVYGHVMSEKRLKKLREPQCIAESICQYSKIRQILDRNRKKDLHEYARRYIQTLVERTLNKTPTSSSRASAYASYDNFASPYTTSSHRLDPSDSLQTAETLLRTHLSSDELDAVRRHTLLALEVSMNLQKNLADVGQSLEELFGIDDHVITSLGPNTDFRCGDVIIIFKRQAMFHPDSDFAVQGAVSFSRNGKAYDRQPWLNAKHLMADRIGDFHSSRLRPSVPGYDHAAAMELAALIGSERKTMNVKLRDVQEHWKQCDTDEVFEGHLPCLIPLDHIDRIIIPQNLYHSLSLSFKDLAKELFRDKITIANDNINHSTISSSDTPCHAYERYVHEEIGQLMTKNNLRSHCGIILTLPATKFQEYICAPFTISQTLLQQETNGGLSETVYIYWEAFGGDMMLVVSSSADDPNRSGSGKLCVMCYIADVPAGNSEHNREPYSYLTINQPKSHELLVQNGDLRAKSNTFHRGCNIYDYIRYCLKINLKTGDMTLTHAGSNGIYNQETIVCKYRQKELDINDPQYIHLSAYGHTVPIRGLVAHDAPINDSHPSIDSSFRGNDQSSPSSPKSPMHALNNLLAVVPKPNDNYRGQRPRSHSRSQPVVNNNGDKRNLMPCRAGVNCLEQNSRSAAESHNKLYSHPCRFSELCLTKSDHPHLEHHPHPVPDCRFDGQCTQLTDVYHRSSYRHRNYPDFLLPCRSQKACPDKRREHLIKYSHGEIPYPFF